MPKITKVYTRTGDNGDTSLGAGHRVSKDNQRIIAYGTVDELNSLIGLAISFQIDELLKKELLVIQNELFNLGSDLCFLEEDKSRIALPQIEERHVINLESIINNILSKLKPLENFILPGGSLGASQLHVARTVCRRAEREVITLSKVENIGKFVIKYLNRLSDVLFVMARYENYSKGIEDTCWNSHK